MSPIVSGSRGTRTHKRVSPATCFQDRLLIRPDDFLKLRGLESNQRPSGSEPDVATSSNHPAVLSTIRASRSPKGSGRRDRTFTDCFKGRRPTVSRSPIVKKCPVGVEPTFPAWKAGAFAARPRAHDFSRRKERESNPQGSDARPFSKRLPSRAPPRRAVVRLALP